jgi:hypothetical protein
MFFPFFSKRPPRKGNPRMLGVLLCYNDADILPDVIEHLLTNNHAIIAWDHGSDDGTAAVLDRYQSQLLERQLIPRSFDFYKLYQAMSAHLIKNYIRDYEWISWPDQDEILEGPDRTKSYYSWVLEVLDSKHTYVQFNNFNYWFTTEDDPAIESPAKRIHRYAVFPDCAPRIRAWKAKVTNTREFNHNSLKGSLYPQRFNLRHYPMRTAAQMERRIQKDRANLQRDGINYHYNNMKSNASRLFIPHESLLLDDGKSELQHTPVFNWRSIYGHNGATSTTDVSPSTKSS